MTATRTATGEDFGVLPTRAARSARGQTLAQISALELLLTADRYPPLRRAILERWRRQEGQPEAPAPRDPLEPFRRVARALYQPGVSVVRPLYLHADGISEVRDYSDWGFSDDELRFAASLIVNGADLTPDEATFAELAMREALVAMAEADATEQERQDMDRAWRELRAAEADCLE